MHMQTPSRRVVLLVAAAGACLPLLAACAAPGGKVAYAGASEAALLARARAYWAAMQDNDGVAAWDYEAVSKKPGTTLQGYLKSRSMSVNAAEVQRVESIDGDQAIVEVLLTYDVPPLHLRNRKSLVRDHWRLIDNAWYHAPAPSALFGPPKESSRP